MVYWAKKRSFCGGKSAHIYTVYNMLKMHTKYVHREHAEESYLTIFPVKFTVQL